MSDGDSNQTEEFRQAGLQGKNLLAPQMIAALENPPHLGYTYTTIHALAQLGAMDRLDVIRSYAQDDTTGKDITGGDLKNFSRVAVARLLAESGAQSNISSEKASVVKVRRFYKELGMKPADLNDDLSAYYPSQQPPVTSTPNRWVGPAADTSSPHPAGVYAVRELADMMYHGAYNDCRFLPEITQVNFARDYPAALKMRLAPLSPTDRLTTLLQELSHKTVLTHWDDYEIQLASNEGLKASRAAVQLLQRMEAHPEKYDEVGFTALVRVIWGTGDQAQAPLVQHLLENRLIDTGNLPIADLTNGVKRGREPAY